MPKSKVKSAIINSTQTIILLAMLTSLSVICSYLLTFRIGNLMKFSPVFLVIALAGYKFGAVGSVVVAVLTDLIQYLLYPSNGFSIGIFISNVVLGLIFGICFFRKFSISRILTASLCSQVLCTIAIPVYFWVYVEKWYPTVNVIIHARIIQAAIMFIIINIVLYLLFIKTDLIKKLKI